MKKLSRDILEQLIDGLAEPIFVAQINNPDWPVILCNAAFVAIAGKDDVLGKPLTNVVEGLVGRDLALEISETVRGGHETTIAVELGNREYLLVLKPLMIGAESSVAHYAAYWRNAGSAAHGGDSDVQQALLKAKRRIRDMSRDDPVTGLLNERSFREVLAHDWAVAAREKTNLGLIVFTLDDFPAYLEVFGRHAADSCLRRVAQALRRCLRRASDVAARVESGAGNQLIILSHTANGEGVSDFAEQISTAVRELGLHHPRSGESRFVTVSYRQTVRTAGADGNTELEFLEDVLRPESSDQ